MSRSSYANIPIDTRPRDNDGELIIEPLVPVDVVDILQATYEPLEWIIPDYLPEGLTLLFAKPKVGKSMLSIALSLRTAKRVNGGMSGTTLYMSLDDGNMRRYQSRVRSLLQGEEVDRGRFYVVTSSQGLDSGLLKQLEMWISYYTDTVLIVVDVFAAIKSKKKDNDVFGSDYRAMKPLQEFAVKHHLAIILVHHTRKQKDNGGDWADNINGSTGLSAAVDTLWTLDREQFSNELLLKAKGRDVPEIAVTIDLEDIDHEWVVSEEEESESKEEVLTTTQKILAVIGEVDMTPKQISEISGCGTPTVRKVITRMLQKNLVEQTTYGKYRIGRVAAIQKMQGEPQSDYDVSTSSYLICFDDVKDEDLITVAHQVYMVPVLKESGGNDKFFEFETKQGLKYAGYTKGYNKLVEWDSSEGLRSNVRKSIMLNQHRWELTMKNGLLK